jgi:hypothetical protein
MHCIRMRPVAPLLFVSLLLFIPGCISSRRVIKTPLACHQIGPDYEIGVGPGTSVSNGTACVDKKQGIHWKRVDGDKGFRIQFIDPKTPIRPISQECRNECRAEILPEALIGSVWTYSVTDLTTGKTSDPVIIIDGCC